MEFNDVLVEKTSVFNTMYYGKVQHTNKYAHTFQCDFIDDSLPNFQGSLKIDFFFNGQKTYYVDLNIGDDMGDNDLLFSFQCNEHLYDIFVPYIVDNKEYKVDLSSGEFYVNVYESVDDDDPIEKVKAEVTYSPNFVKELSI